MKKTFRIEVLTTEDAQGEKTWHLAPLYRGPRDNCASGLSLDAAIIQADLLYRQGVQTRIVNEDTGEVKHVIGRTPLERARAYLGETTEESDL